MMPKIFFSFFFLILLVSNAYAFDCSYFGDPEECQALIEVDENLIADLIYTNTYYANHSFIQEYNDNIVVNSPPEEVTIYNKGVLNDVWVKILSLSPSVLYDNELIVDETVKVRSEYAYQINIPEDYYNSYQSNGAICEIQYSLNSQSEQFFLTRNSVVVGTEKTSTATISFDAYLTAILEVWATTKAEISRWNRYCSEYDEGDCVDWDFSCDYSDTEYTTDQLSIHDSIQVKPYQGIETPFFQFISEYYGSSKGILTKNNKTNVVLSFENSFFREQDFEFSANFTNNPFYLLQLEAVKRESTSQSNLIRDNYTFYVQNTNDCQIEYSGFFSTGTTTCNYNYTGEEIDEFETKSFSGSFSLLLKLIVFVFVCYLIYLGIKKSWGKKLIPGVALLLVVPMVSADECGLTNLASCIPEKIYDYFINLINAPLAPFLELTRNLLENAPSIDLFQSIWVIIIYCISMFYGILFIYSGFQFLFSGHNVIKREIAKEWLKNTVIMIVLVQASFYLYELIIELGAIMTSAILSLVNEEFFMLTASNIVNVGMEFLFLSFYVLTLMFTILLLTIRYLIVSFGVIFAPIGIFCYFIPPLKSYGKLILNTLGMFIFITFLDGMIILACSLMVELPFFENVKMLVMIACFNIINLLFFMLLWHVIFKSSISDSGEKVTQAVKYIAMFV